MSLLVFCAVIGAAALHAVWNALIKSGKDKYLNMTAVVLGHAPLAVFALLTSPVPAVSSWPYLAVGVLLHIGYQFFLLWAYRAGDLTEVYPLARGSAPLIIAIVSVCFLGTVLSPIEFLAILVIAAGLFCLAMVRQEERALRMKTTGLALVTGIFIAAYSLVDGMGARLANTSLGYYAWLAVLNAIVFAALMLKHRPRVIKDLWPKARFVFLFGGAFSFLAYAIVTWAFTQAPIAIVSALRETSIVFALLIGVFFLRERLNLTRIASIMTTCLGAILLRVAKS